MEFKLNQIDVELRQQVHDTTSDGKIHTKQGIVIGKEKREKNSDSQSNKYSILKYNNKVKKIVINASKSEIIEVDAFKESFVDNDKDVLSGSFIDIRK